MHTPSQKAPSLNGWFGLSLALILLAPMVNGCAHFVASATGDLADGLSTAILDQSDPETVRQGSPAYLLMIDGLISKNPRNERLLRAGASLYSSYAAIFVDDATRSMRLTDRAWDYAKQALCQRRRSACDMDRLPIERFSATVSKMKPADIPALYTYGATWAGWIEAHQDDWDAVANLPKVEVTMQRVLELDEGYENGGAHLYLGVLYTLLPPPLGGKPEEARHHLEKALEFSGGRNLMIKVVIAERYARPLFKRELHDSLLNEVLDANPAQPGFTLMNVLAQERARALMKDANEYF